MDARRFDALARALTTGASRRRLLQMLPGVAVGGLLPRAGSVRALDGGDVAACPTPDGGRACTGGADCAADEICLNGFCAPNAAAGSAANPTPTPGDQAGVARQPAGSAGGGQAADGAGVDQETPEAAGEAGGQAATAAAPVEAAGGGQEPTPAPRRVTTPTAGEDDPDGTPVPAGGLEETPEAAGQEETPEPGGEPPAISPNQPLSAQLHEGVCGSLNVTPAFPLIDIGAAGGAATPVADGAPDGQSTALPAGISTTVVDVDFEELLSAPYAIDVRLDPDDPDSSIACGDIGAPADVPRPADALAIGLASRNNSGYAGIAYIQDEGERVVVNVFVAPNLAGGAEPSAGEAVGDAEATDEAAVTNAPAFAAGLTVVITEEVNLRAAPSGDAMIVGTLSAGQVLTVTAAPVDGWVPVRDPGIGRPGYVSAEYVALSE